MPNYNGVWSLTTQLQYAADWSADNISPAALAAGGGGGSNINVIDYVTIASTGDAQDFGDLSVGRGRITATSSKNTYAVWMGGSGPSNVMDYVTISSTGNASDWGDLDATVRFGSGLSNNHGGL